MLKTYKRLLNLIEYSNVFQPERKIAVSHNIFALVLRFFVYCYKLDVIHRKPKLDFQQVLKLLFVCSCSIVSDSLCPYGL